MKNKTQVTKAIILAAGYSKRMGLSVPKQLAKIDNRPMLAYTLDVFEGCKEVDGIILVINRAYRLSFHNLISKYGYKKVEKLCLGGRSRQQSVFNALGRIGNCDYVVIHDGVRPLVTAGLLRQIIRAARRFGAATCAVKAVDTITEAENGVMGRLLARNKLWRIQTPQAFKLNLIYQAHRAARARKVFNASDDAQLLAGINRRVKLVQGSYENIKVTTPSDLGILGHILRDKKQCNRIKL